MSIIYEALKKVDESIAVPEASLSPSQEKKKPSQSHLLLLLYLGVVAAGCFIASIIFSFFTARGSGNIPTVKKNSLNTKKDELQLSRNQNAASKSEKSNLLSSQGNILSPLLTRITTEIKQKQAPEGLILNGLFFSENQDSFVLINNRILKEGDAINGAVVKQIFLNEVVLEKNGSTIKLSNQ